MTGAIMHKPHSLPLPGILWGDYPERRAEEIGRASCRERV